MPSQLKYIVEASMAILLGIIAVKMFDFFSSSSFSVNPPPIVNAEEEHHAIVSSKGRELFYQNCASCHSITKTVTGPALAGVDLRVPDRNLLIAWIKNNQKVLQTRNPYFTSLLKEYNNISMTMFPQLTDEDVGLILDYIQHEETRSVLPMP